MPRIKINSVQCITPDEIDKDEMYLKKDGKKIWSVDYAGGNPPIWRLWHHASFINLPFMVLDSRVSFGVPSRAALPGDEKQYDVVKLADVEILAQFGFCQRSKLRNFQHADLVTQCLARPRHMTLYALLRLIG